MVLMDSALLDVFKQIDVRPEHGEGAWIFATGGKRYLDFYGGHAVTLLGNAHPRLVAALREQAEKLFFVSNAVALDVRERAARRLVSFGPKGLARAFFVNSGAEANENALRIAFLATKRKRVVCVEGAFHGRTAGAAAITAHSERWYGYPHSPFPVTQVPPDDEAALDRAIDDEVAAVILEPVQGVAGARALSPSFIERARELSAGRGALLIFDEVQCGMGRTGYPFAAQALGLTPDLLTVAKGLAGGFPAGAVLVREELAGRLNEGDLGTTFGGGPIACALMETVIDVLESDGLLARVRRLSDRLRRECLVGPVQAIQGMGLMLGLRTRQPAADVLAELRQRGILAGNSADPHVLRLLPPLMIEDAHVDMLVAALKEIPE
jgi:acetylornithine/succinyldiaminopimelate/putrescine aminotransferase